MHVTRQFSIVRTAFFVTSDAAYVSKFASDIAAVTCYMNIVHRLPAAGRQICLPAR